MGFGLFNLVEGIIDHHVLGLHHVFEYASTQWLFDSAFLASGVLLLIVGWALVKAGARDEVTTPRRRRVPLALPNNSAGLTAQHSASGSRRALLEACT